MLLIKLPKMQSWSNIVSTNSTPMNKNSFIVTDKPNTPHKAPTKPCMFHFKQQYNCNKGDKCTFSHDPEVAAKFYCPEQAEYECRDAGCPFSHNEKDMRKVFNVGDQPVTACGVLLWKPSESGKLYYTIEDIGANGYRGMGEPGGKADGRDNTPFDTARREFQEETNTKLPNLQWNTIVFPHAKYMLYMSKVNPDFEIGGRGKWLPYVPGSFVRIADHFPF
jgi:NUDIX domain